MQPSPPPIEAFTRVAACAPRAALACEPFTRVRRSVDAVAGRRVVFGTFADGTDGIAILDSRGTRLDGFACFAPTLSPGGRRLAFQRYATPHERVALRYRGLVAVYDLAASPRANRAGVPDGRFPGRVVNPRAMTGDASERWVGDIAWRGPALLHFRVRYDERTRDVSIAFGS